MKLTRLEKAQFTVIGVSILSACVVWSLLLMVKVFHVVSPGFGDALTTGVVCLYMTVLLGAAFSLPREER